MAAPYRPDTPDRSSGLVPMTLEQFLEWEERQERRYEFDGRYPVAMTGSTIRHNLIGGNVWIALREPAMRAGCRTLANDVQVRTPAGKVYYPDVLVNCGSFDLDERHARTPCLVAEVTSKSTRHADRGKKRDEYLTIPSLQAYVIVEQGMRRLECDVRQADGTWTHLEVSDATDLEEFATPCVDAVLELTVVYAGTDVPPPPPQPVDAR